MDINIFSKEIVKVALIPQIFNEEIYSINTEYPKFIGEVRKFTFKARGGIFKIGFAETMSNVSYVLLADSASYNEDNILTKSDFKIFFQSDTVGSILEIITWQ